MVVATVAAAAAAVAVVIRRRRIWIYTNSVFSLSSFSVISDFGWFSVLFMPCMYVVCVHICVCRCVRTYDSVESSEASSKTYFVLKSTLGRVKCVCFHTKRVLLRTFMKFPENRLAVLAVLRVCAFVSLFFRWAACKDVCVPTTSSTLYMHACKCACGCVSECVVLLVVRWPAVCIFIASLSGILAF